MTLSRPMAADLVDWVVVVVSPEEVAAHLVALVQAGGAHAAHLQVVTPAPAQCPELVLFLLVLSQLRHYMLNWRLHNVSRREIGMLLPKSSL